MKAYRDDLQVVFSLLVVAFVFWFCMFGAYIYSGLINGHSVSDAIVFLIPILFVVVSLGVCVFYPYYLFLERRNKGSIYYMLPSAIIFSLLSVLLVTQQYTDYTIYLSAVFSAIIGTIIFMMLVGKKQQVKK